MKTVLAVLITALVTSSGAYAVEQAVTPGQFAALKRQVAVLQKQQNLIAGYIGTCLGKWQPETQFTNYLAFDATSNQPFETSGIDLTGSGEQPNFFTPTASQDCTLHGSRSLAQVLDRPTIHATGRAQTRTP